MRSAVLAAVDAVGGDLALAGLALAELPGLAGRGARLQVPAGDGTALLIDESYNANNASMRATLNVLSAAPAVRRLAVLGEMRELGERSAELHVGLADPILAAGIDGLILVGPEMMPLARALEQKVNFVHVADAAAALDAIREQLQAGDAVLVKGSNGVGLSAVVAGLVGQA